MLVLLCYKALKKWSMDFYTFCSHSWSKRTKYCKGVFTFLRQKRYSKLPTDCHSEEWKWLYMWLLLGMWYIFSYSDIFSPQRAVLDFRLSEPSWYTVGIVLMLGTIAAYLAARKTWSKWTVVTVTNNLPLCKLWKTEYQLSTSELND